jgi:hypothetical protein
MEDAHAAQVLQWEEKYVQEKLKIQKSAPIIETRTQNGDRTSGHNVEATG